MSRFFTVGLLASTILVAAPLAAQERSSNRGDWIRNQTQQQQQNTRSGGGDRQRERAPMTRPQRTEAPQRSQEAPQRAQQARPDRPASAVTTQRVPPSSAERPQWRDSRGGEDRATRPARPDRASPDRAEQQRPRNWNDTARNNSDGRSTDRARNDDRRQSDWNRDRAERGDRARDDRRGNDWRSNDRARNNDRDRNARDRNDWSQQRNWNYQRRLNERERWNDQRRWDNRWRADRRYDWQRYRTQYRQVYRMPSYRAPYGWNYGYRQFSIGIHLNNILFSSNYWIDDPYRYRLPPAYGSLRWIRYYDDALLVDMRDGYVVDVIHNFFW